MKISMSITLFLLLITCVVKAQFFENMVMKTRPLQDFIGYNPTLDLKKYFHLNTRLRLI